MATSVQVTFDCADPGRLAKFWASALGYVEQPPPAGYDSWQTWAIEHQIPPEEWDSRAAVVDPDGAGPRLFFQRVPEAKTVKNRVHLDVNVGAGLTEDDRRMKVAAEAERLVGEGASRLRVFDEDNEFWIVMQDPEGNEFCLQ